MFLLNHFEIFIFLMATAIVLVGAAQKFRVPFPIILVLGGTAIGFIPGLNTIQFDPDLLLVLVLPPILYYSAFWTSLRDFKQNFKEIFSLALGLVVLTTLVVGVLFKWLFPEFPWALAFAFGAIVSPPDATAATSILKRFSMGPRLLSILEGESLVNDASALVLYKIAVTALLTGVFSWHSASIEFVKVTAGGVLVGTVTGFLLQIFSTRYLPTVTAVMFSLTIPYITYIIAERLDVSGVLAVVINGLIGVRYVVKNKSSLRRVFGVPIWDMTFILLNCFVFMLIGLHLKTISAHMTMEEMTKYSVYGFLITSVMMIVRLCWVYVKHSIAYFKAKRKLNYSNQCRQIFREGVILGWSGMRGIVSLAAALALPIILPDGMPITGRETVIFITFIVILLSLVVPGLTLPILLRLLKIHHTPDTEMMNSIRKDLDKVSEKVITHLSNITENERTLLKTYFKTHHDIQEISSSLQNQLHPIEFARLKVLEAQRQFLLEIWESKKIDDVLLRTLELELDFEETRAARARI